METITFTVILSVYNFNKLINDTLERIFSIRLSFSTMGTERVKRVQFVQMSKYSEIQVPNQTCTIRYK